MFVQRETTSASDTLEKPSNGLIFFGFFICPPSIVVFGIGPHLAPVLCKLPENGIWTLENCGLSAGNWSEAEQGRHNGGRIPKKSGGIAAGSGSLARARASKVQTA